MSPFILQLFFRFSYVTAHSTTHSVALPTSQLSLQPFRCLTYVTAHSPTLPLLHLHHNSFSNPSVASPTSQLILQPFRCFTYVKAHSPTLSLLLRHRLFTYVTWRAAHDDDTNYEKIGGPSERSIGRKGSVVMKSLETPAIGHRQSCIGLSPTPSFKTN